MTSKQQQVKLEHDKSLLHLQGNSQLQIKKRAYRLLIAKGPFVRKVALVTSFRSQGAKGYVSVFELGVPNLVSQVFAGKYPIGPNFPNFSDVQLIVTNCKNHAFRTQIG